VTEYLAFLYVSPYVISDTDILFNIIMIMRKYDHWP
jgi:hypothetical protein